MPNYVYHCPNQHQFERFLIIAHIEKEQFCDICGKQGERQIQAPLLVKGQSECRYDSPITGEIITSHHQRREDMKKHGCVEYDPEMKTDYLRGIEERDRELDRKIDETVEQSFESMSSQQRNRLATELLQDGADIEYTVK